MSPISSRRDITTHRLTLHTPPGFDFWRTVYSHGWCDLPPFTHDAARRELGRILLLADGTTVHCFLTGNDGSVRVSVSATHYLSSNQKQEIRRQLGTCLRLDEDLRPFHSESTKHPRFRWIARTGSGRMLRAPTVFEDTVKMICTTNCTWALTKVMVRNLVERFGKNHDTMKHAFPSPETLAGTSEHYLRTKVKAGYRAPYILELAEAVASGKLNLESWRTSTVSTEELFRQMREVKGIGPYAAGNILKLVGRYDYLGLDSWVRAQYYRIHSRGRKVKDSTIEKHYARYGKWRGLFFWMEMTRDVLEEEFSAG